MSKHTNKMAKQIHDVLDYVELDKLEKYLGSKYDSILTAFAEDRNEKAMDDIVSDYAEMEIMDMIDKAKSMRLKDDPKLNELIVLSADIYRQGREMIRSGKKPSDPDEYKKTVLKLSTLMEDVHPCNHYMGMSFYSTALVDLGYIYGKSSSLSLRLATV